MSYLARISTFLLISVRVCFIIQRPPFAFLVHPAQFYLIIIWFLGSLVRAYVVLISRESDPNTEIIEKNPSSPIVKCITYTVMCKGSQFFALTLSIDCIIVLYACLRGEWYLSTILIVPGVSIGASSIISTYAAVFSFSNFKIYADPWLTDRKSGGHMYVCVQRFVIIFRNSFED